MRQLLFFQGGGACWDVLSTTTHTCSTGAFPQGPSGGVFERSELSNPFRTYTLVHVLYCDGSLHGGNTTRPYRDRAGVPVSQVGYENTRSVLNWIETQMKTGQLAPTLSSLVISGSSAGSIGAQLWADQVLRSLPHLAAAVVPDSYIGVFPTHAEGRLITQYGFCSSPLLARLPASIRASCLQATLSLHAVTAAVLDRHQSVAFAHIQSKIDEVQIEFDWALSSDPSVEPAGCADKRTCYVDGTDFYARSNEYLELYNRRPNHVHFLVQSSQHTYLPNRHMYEADASGATAGGKGGERLIDWLTRLPLRNGSNGTISTRCDGQLLGPGTWHGDSYCDLSMAGKVFHAPPGDLVLLPSREVMPIRGAWTPIV